MDKKKNKSVGLSAIDLNDPGSVKKVVTDRAVAFFCKNLPVRVDYGLLSELKGEALKAGPRNVRICLHHCPDAEFHNMIICEKKGTHYPPHKHLRKGETFHIIEGSMAVFVFDDSGNIMEAVELNNESLFIYRVQVNGYHAVMPLTNLVVYHESKPGPFIGDEDNIIPPWAPDAADKKKIGEYEKNMLAALKR